MILLNLIALTPEMEKYGWGLAAAGVLLVSASLLMRIRKKQQTRGGKVTARENLERYKAKGQVKDDLERVMVEVEQMAKRVSAQLDAKAILVEKLLSEADQKIEQLKALQQPDGPPPPAAPPTDTPPEPGPTPAAEPGADELSRSVYALADEGLTPPDIARKLDEHVGKVELILALRSA